MGKPLRQWNLHFVQSGIPEIGDPLLARAYRYSSEGSLLRPPTGRPFLLDNEGFPHAAFNGFFASSFIRNRADSTGRKYAFAVKVWLNFLALRGLDWDSATETEFYDFKFWRRSDPDNPRPVSGSTWDGDVAGLQSFYRWTGRVYGVSGPLPWGEKPIRFKGSEPIVDSHVKASTVRTASVKWLSPGAVRQWRDVGIHGLTVTGSERIRWRPRSTFRDGAFVDGLYSSGLRLQEWSSLLLPEISVRPSRTYITLQLASACAKNQRGHRYWLETAALASIEDYIRTERAGAVRRGQESGLYADSSLRIVVQSISPNGKMLTTNTGGKQQRLSLDSLTPAERTKLVWQGENGLEPLWLWLNEDGSCRRKRAWYRSFSGANERVRKAGIERLQCHPHMLRHSFALKWYAVGRLIWEQQIQGLTHREILDFREQFGDTWSFVQTMLGHANVMTTREIYLEPFRELEVRHLLEFGQAVPGIQSIVEVLRGDPRVRLNEQADQLTW